MRFSFNPNSVALGTITLRWRPPLSAHSLRAANDCSLMLEKRSHPGHRQQATCREEGKSINKGVHHSQEQP